MKYLTEKPKFCGFPADICMIKQHPDPWVFVGKKKEDLVTFSQTCPSLTSRLSLPFLAETGWMSAAFTETPPSRWRYGGGVALHRSNHLHTEEDPPRAQQNAEQVISRMRREQRCLQPEGDVMEHKWWTSLCRCTDSSRRAIYAPDDVTVNQLSHQSWGVVCLQVILFDINGFLAKNPLKTARGKDLSGLEKFSPPCL